MKIIVPKGTVIHDFTLKGGRETSLSKRKQTVEATYLSPGYVDEGRTVPAKVTWAGRGGYWRDAEVTQALLDANPGLEKIFTPQEEAQGE